MKISKGVFTVNTARKMEFVDISSKVEQEIGKTGIRDGICYLYNPHTTAGLTINEGADPAVRTDIIGVFDKIMPADFPYRHLEGNSPAHFMTTLVGTSLTVFMEAGRLDLGTWQKIYFCEFDGPRNRKVKWRLVA